MKLEMSPLNSMSIKNRINLTCSFNELRQLQSSITVHISFWGGHWITAKGYTGTASIDDLAQKTLALNIGEAAQEFRHPIQKQIIGLYTEANQKIWIESCLITKIFFTIRHFFYAIFGICFLGMSGDVFFNMASDTQDRWEKKYGAYLDTSDGAFGDPTLN